MKKTLTKEAGIISIITIVWVMTMPVVAQCYENTRERLRNSLLF